MDFKGMVRDDLVSVMFDENEFADIYQIEAEPLKKIILIETDEYEVNDSSYRAYLAMDSEFKLLSLKDGDKLLFENSRFEIMNHKEVDGDRKIRLVMLKEIQNA